MLPNFVKSTSGIEREHQEGLQVNYKDSALTRDAQVRARIRHYHGPKKRSKTGEILGRVQTLFWFPPAFSYIGRNLATGSSEHMGTSKPIVPTEKPVVKVKRQPAIHFLERADQFAREVVLNKLSQLDAYRIVYPKHKMEA